MICGALSARTAGGLLFCLSLLTLVTEVLQVRIFSYSLDPQTVYMAISVALLGFGLSAVILACKPGWRAIDPGRAVAGNLVLFGLATLLSNLLFAATSTYVSAIMLMPGTGFTLVNPASLVFLLCATPYFFAGRGIALGILGARGDIGKRYFLNLAASGLGCALVFPLLSRMGAEGAICLVSGAALLVGGISLYPFNKSATVAALAGVMLAAHLGANREQFEFAPDFGDFPSGVTRPIMQRYGDAVVPTRTFARWDPIAKVELYEWPGAPHYFHQTVPVQLFTQDAGSISTILGFAGHPSEAQSFARGSNYGAATVLRPGANVLIIGLGGAPDALAALANGASHVTGVDINDAAIAAVEQTAHITGLDQVATQLSLVHADGRGFVETHHNEFDVIQMTGAETWSANYVSGSVLSENYLYTLEGVASLFGALKPDGILAITRFGIEPMRNASTVLASLRAMGITDPGRHVIVLAQGTSTTWGTILAKRTVFTADEIARIEKFVDDSGPYAQANTMPLFDAIAFGINAPMRLIYAPGRSMAAPAADQRVRNYRALIHAADENRLAEWAAAQPRNFEPTTDDKPFFFQFERFKLPKMSDLFSHKQVTPYGWDPSGYIRLTFQFAVVAFILMFLPVFFVGRRAPRSSGSFQAGVCFLGIGLGFMFVEVGLMQKLTLFLGHPNYAISTVLFSILIFAGVGSYASQRAMGSAIAALRWSMPLIALGVVVIILLSTTLLPLAMGLPLVARILIAVLMIAPLAFLMGTPFPTLLTWLEARNTSFAPQALAINGFASVFASLASIPLSSALGFRAVLLIGASIYVLGWLTLPRRASADAQARESVKVLQNATIEGGQNGRPVLSEPRSVHAMDEVPR